MRNKTFLEIMVKECVIVKKVLSFLFNTNLLVARIKNYFYSMINMHLKMIKLLLIL